MSFPKSLVNTLNQQSKYSNRAVRLGVSLFYFAQGLCFASWASRIPDIKHALNLSDAALGSILLCLPFGQLLTMPTSGRLTAKYGSKTMLTLAAPFYFICLTNIALASAPWHLALALFLFGIVGNLCNISLNTQAVIAENHIRKPIMSSFHGSWSLGMFTGALIGLLMMNLHANLFVHFWTIAIISFIHIYINHRFLVISTAPPVTPVKRKLFLKPEGILLQLGIIAFCAMATEGALMDWSGVYFKEVVHAPAKWVVLGYVSYAGMMTVGRFLGDKLIFKYGRKQLLQLCGITISVGMFLSVIFPNIVTAAVGFMLVGLGVSIIIPMLYSVAGNNNKVSASVALAMVSSVGYFGFLFGPPLIGYISELFNLRFSFALVGCFGILITILVSKIKMVTN